MKYFDWIAGIVTAQPEAYDGVNATLLLYGATEAGAAVAARCDYVVPLVAVGTPLTTLKSPRCTLLATFARVVDVEFQLAGGLSALQFFALEDRSYVLHKKC